MENISVISSIGADHSSLNNYLRIKGEMEQGLMKEKFRSLVILRPSILLGSRNERRTAETLGKIMIRIFGPFMIGRLAKYKGIEAMKVAGAMVSSIASNTGIQILESDEIQKILRT